MAEIQVKPIGKNNALSYMLFGLGVVLVLVSVFLFTFSSVEMVTTSVQVGTEYSVDVPHPETVYPYRMAGVVSLVMAIVLIGIALVKIAKK